MTLSIPTPTPTPLPLPLPLQHKAPHNGPRRADQGATA